MATSSSPTRKIVMKILSMLVSNKYPLLFCRKKTAITIFRKIAGKVYHPVPGPTLRLKSYPYSSRFSTCTPSWIISTPAARNISKFKFPTPQYVKLPIKTNFLTREVATSIIFLKDSVNWWKILRFCTRASGGRENSTDGANWCCCPSWHLHMPSR